MIGLWQRRLSADGVLHRDVLGELGGQGIRGRARYVQVLLGRAAAVRGRLLGLAVAVVGRVLCLGRCPAAPQYRTFHILL